MRSRGQPPSIAGSCPHRWLERAPGTQVCMAFEGTSGQGRTEPLPILYFNGFLYLGRRKCGWGTGSEADEISSRRGGEEARKAGLREGWCRAFTT